MMSGPDLPFLLATDLRKSFRQGETTTTVLDGVDLSIRRGESLALLGVSGTGKSTLLNILGGIETADGGRISVNGAEVDLSPEALATHRRQNVGFVFQFYNLLPSLTVLENVLAGLDAMGRLPNDAIAKARASLDSVGLADRADNFPTQLSGGQQQRVAIARALVKRAPLILADEPTGNLDPHTGDKVLQTLLQQCKENGSALIIVTHNEHIAQRTNRAVTLVDGKVKEWVAA